MDNINSKIFKINKKYLIIATIVAFLNNLFYDNYYISLVIVIAEISILLYFLIKGNLIEYVCFYLIFLAPCFEFVSFITNDLETSIYGFKNFRIIGMNLGLIFIILPLVYIMFNGVYIFNKIESEKFKNILFIKNCFLFMTISSTIMGIINIAINDNNIRNIEKYYKIFIGEAYIEVWTLITVIVVIQAIFRDKKNAYMLENALISVLLSSVLSLIFSLIFHRSGSYSTFKTLLVSTVSWYIPFLLTLPFYKRYKKNRVFLFLMAIIGTSILMQFNSNGKIILFVMLMPIFIIIINSKKNLLESISSVILIFAIAIIVLSYIVPILKVEGSMFSYKLKDVISLIEFWKPGWLLNMGESPQFRISEFLNVAIEYWHKPVQLFLGKGILGSTKDYIQMFGWNLEGAFTIDQYQNGSFYALHETFNTIFLRNGIVGLILYIKIFNRSISKLNNNPWLLIGSVWFVLLYGYSMTLGVFGIISLVIGHYLYADK